MGQSGGKSGSGASAALTPERIGDIYAAAAEPDALERLSDLLRAMLDLDSVGFWITRDGTIEELAVTSDLQESVEPYLAYYSRLDPWSINFAKSPNQVSIGYEIYAEKELVRTEFYNDFAKRFDLFRPMGFVADLEPGVLVRTGFSRNAPRALLQDDDKKTLDALRPHLTRALRTRLRFRAVQGSEQAAYAAAAFDRLAFGIVVCEASGRVLYANEAALSFDLGRYGLTLRGTPVRLGAAARGESEALARLVFQAAWRIGGAGGALRLSGENGRLAALVTPLTPATGEFGAAWKGGAGMAMVCLQREDAAPGAGTTALRSLYGLSPVQAELCRALSAGRTLEEAASERGVSSATVRTHLRTILARTDSRNLRDLLRLLDALPSLSQS